MFTLVVLSSLLFAFGCGEGSKQESSGGDGTFGGKAYQIVANEGLNGSDEEIKGSGSVLFRDPLGEVAGNKSVALDFSLEDGGSLALVTFADTTLQNGSRITFVRSGATLSAGLEIGSQKTDARTLSGVDASGVMSLVIDVHNSETPLHTLVWNRGVSSYTSSTSIYDSEASQVQIQGNGIAPYWGVTLVKGTLSKASVTEARFVD
jgi:hypothetical protein